MSSPAITAVTGLPFAGKERALAISAGAQPTAFGFVNPKAVSGIETTALKEGAMLAALPRPLASGKRRRWSCGGEPFILMRL